jgi:hypothetical protein
MTTQTAFSVWLRQRPKCSRVSHSVMVSNHVVAMPSGSSARNSETAVNGAGMPR